MLPGVTLDTRFLSESREYTRDPSLRCRGKRRYFPLLERRYPLCRFVLHTGAWAEGLSVRQSMLFVGLDDTDMPGTRGTGHLARDVAAWLGADYPVAGVTRHQLLHDRRIPFTANNSSNVIMLDAPEADRFSILDRVAAFVPPQCPEGSDPGLCVAMPEQVQGLMFGHRCQREIIPVALAVETAASRNVLLRSLAGSPCGMIGALAGVCLAASGNDGRFVHVGKVRDLHGRVPLEAVLEAGVARVLTEDGTAVQSGSIETGDKLRPALRDGKPTLYVRPVESHVWEALKI